VAFCCKYSVYLAAIVLAALTSDLHAQDRVAFMIANSDYGSHKPDEVTTYVGTLAMVPGPASAKSPGRRTYCFRPPSCGREYATDPEDPADLPDNPGESK
jgi:hypothetical protein